MKRHPLILAIFILFPVLAWGQLQWNENGILISSLTTTSTNLHTTPDGRGGMFITYTDNPLGDFDIYAQWMDGTGQLRWASAKTKICTDGGDQRYPVSAADGSGGVFIAWQDELAGQIMARHLDMYGNVLQTIDVCSATGEQSRVAMVADGSGGVILVWMDKRNGTKTDLYGQRIDYNGNKLWGASGIAVTTAADNQSSQILIGDGKRGAVVIWQDYRNGNYDIYAQRIDSTGVQVWTSDGLAICTISGNQLSPALTLSEEQVIMAWQDYRNGNSDVYAQAVSLSGTNQWTVQGAAICEAVGTQMQLSITADGAGGAILAWSDNRTFYDIYAQRIDSEGNPIWLSGGVAVNASSGYQYLPQAISDGANGIFVVWLDNRTESDLNLYAQHVDSNGDPMWETGGIPVVDETGSQQTHSMISDGSGGFFTTWHDGRSGNNLYSQHFNDNLTVDSPSSGELWGGGFSHSIEWTCRDSSLAFDHLSLHLSLFEGDGYPHEIDTSVDPTSTDTEWNPAAFNSTTSRLKIIGRDDRDSVMCEYISPLFSLDSNPPEVFGLISPANNATTELRPTFTWQSTTDNLSGLDHYELWIDGSLVEDGLTVTSHTLTQAQTLTAGTHQWTVKAVDKAGLVREAAGRTLNTTDDNTPPSAFHLTAPANGSWLVEVNPSFAWQASTDAGSGLQKYQIVVNGELRMDNISPSVTATESLPLEPGSHTWYVIAVDSAGNKRQSSESWTVKIDNVPPKKFDLLTPSNNAWTQDATPRFYWEATQDTSTGIGLSEYQLWIDDALVFDRIPADSTSKTLPQAQALSQGIHTWYILAKDSLGNCRVSTSSFTLKIDNAAPSAFDLTIPANDAVINTIQPLFSWNASSDALAGIKQYELWLDGTLAGTYTTNSGQTAPLTEGLHHWMVKAQDAAGNSRNSSTFFVTCDTTRPEAFFLFSPADGDTLHTSKPKFIWRNTSDPGSGLEEYEFYIDGFINKDSLAITDTSWTVTSPIQNGTHYWKVKAWDKAGNVRYSNYHFFTIDCRPPTIESPNSALAVEDVGFSYTAQASDPDGDAVSIEFTGYPDWLTPQGDRITGTPRHGHGNTTFVVQASDGSYTTTLTVALTVQQVNDPPTLSMISNIAIREDSSASILFTIGDEETAASQLSLFVQSDNPALISSDGLILGGSGASRSLKLTPNANQCGIAGITLIVSDESTPVSRTFTLTVQQVNDAPTISAISDGTIPEDSSLTRTFEIHDEETPAGELILTAESSNTILIPGSGIEISGTSHQRTVVVRPVSNRNGTAVVTITVSDGQKSRSSSFQVTVLGVNDPPAISHINDQLGWEDVPLDIHFGVSDDETPLAQLQIQVSSSNTNLVPLSNISIQGTDEARTLTLTGKPDLSGQTTITLRVSDGSLFAEQSFLVTLQPVNDPPKITSLDTVAAVEGIRFVYRPTVSDIDGPGYSIQYQNYPGWMSPAGPEISGIPPNNCSVSSFLVIASDGSLEDSLCVTVLIQGINDPPRFEHPFPRPVFSNVDTLHWELPLLDYASDPDHPDSVLVWSHLVLDSNPVTVTIDPVTHVALIQGSGILGECRILFTVTDPLDASASDTLAINLIKTDVAPIPVTAPVDFVLHPNYPNPFNPVTTIEYGIPRTCHVVLRIYDMLGKEVAALVDARQTPGNYRVVWNASGLPSGLYIARIQADDWKEVNRMILLK